ncbi:ATP-dependent RNA helicase dbp7 [Cryptotrichosporon argae]
MDDGGIELNFASPPAGVVRRQAVAKKGRWTERVKAKQAVRRVVNKLGKQADSSVAPTQAPAPVPAPASVAKPAAVPVRASTAAAADSPVRLRPASASASTRPPARPVAAKPRPSAEAGPSRISVSAPAPPSKTSGAKPRAAQQVISSLFSSNPAVPRPAPIAATASAVGVPSNAPSDSSTFEGLRLDPMLVRHLKGKMGVQAPTGIQKSALPFLLSSPLDLSARPAGEHGEDEDEDSCEARTAPASQPSQPMRDVFIQSQTGSGKTLAFLLPIIQTLLPLSRLSYIDRSIGTLAIILAPTRELAQQIAGVLEQLLTLSLARDDADGAGAAGHTGADDNAHYTRWLVSGLLVGGSTRTHEKARLRKGVPILVSTPGRLLDHLQNTTSFKCAKNMFLVLDEADRLMDLGFEDTINGIIRALDGRRNNEIAAEREMDAEGGGLMRWPYWSRGRRTILCSATVDAKVERLAGAALRDPVVFRSIDDKADAALAARTAAAKDKVSGKDKGKGKGADDAAGGPETAEDAVRRALDAQNPVTLPVAPEDKFTPPAQLAQKYVVAPTKLRLVALVALLRTLVAAGEGTKIIVFLSSTDSVDFHWKMLGGAAMDAGDGGADEDGDAGDAGDGSGDGGDGAGAVDNAAPERAKTAKPKAKAKTGPTEDAISLTAPLFPSAALHRLHGSLPLRTRLASLASFAAPSVAPAVLFATSVASRGLDLPLVRAVVQYDLPTEGGASEYVHRVGRTARAGRGGEAWAFVAPAETAWVPWVEAKMGSGDGAAVKMHEVAVDSVLRAGFGGRGHEYEARATEVQLAFERWVLASDQSAALARKAFSSSIRAYSTHPLDSRRFFAVKALHLGHVAKAFALREAPGQLVAASGGASKKGGKAGKSGASGEAKLGKRKRPAAADDDDTEARAGGKEATARNETERRMYEAVRKAGRAIKSGGELGVFRTQGGAGAVGGEFQVMRAGELERLVRGKP